MAGTEYTREQIDAALATEDKEVRRQMVKTSDVSGHGTAVAESRQGMAGEVREEGFGELRLRRN